MHDTFIDRYTNLLYTLFMNFLFVAVGRWKWNRSWHKWL